MIKIYGHGSYIGNTGYNQHTRCFFRELSKHCDIKFRNFTIGDSWSHYSETPHDNESYINNVDKKILYEQVLWDNFKEKKRSDYKIYSDKIKEFDHDLNIVLCETNHHLFYDDYVGPKIAYNVWESTLQPKHFFDKLLEYDELWVPSKWQKKCTIDQGYPEEKIKVIPEGVDSHVFFPNPNVKHPMTSDGRFKFFLVGRWDYRKSIKEIIETFLKTFSKEEPVDLIITVDNPFSNDGLETTEQRLEHYGLEDERIKVLHFPSRVDYVDILKSCNVFVSCARSEGWNLPLIESMACGTPSIYSNCSGQLEFALNKGLPVRILGELPVSASSYNHFNDAVGNYYEPDFEDLSRVMRYSYENYESVRKGALIDSEWIRENFNWERVALNAVSTITEFFEKNKIINSGLPENKIIISHLDGPKVEILGQKQKKYKVEFIDKKNNKIIFSDAIKNNMWTTCSRKYYTDWIIKINDEVVQEFNLEDKRVLISLESKSIGDTLAWTPYVVEFQKQKKCKVILSTFHNDWFKDLEPYKDIEFITPGSSTICDVLYRIGWFKDDKNGWRKFDSYPNQPNLIPLQKTASDILGLDYHEINHGINFKKEERKIKEKYVVIGPQSTSGCKEWPYEYWSQLAEKLLHEGYLVMSLTQKKFHIKNVANLVTSDWNEIFNYMYHSEFFIGLSSGLSWVNWALNKKTVMIAGFSKNDHEFQNNVVRVSNNVCINCWNDNVFVFDNGDWDWCPVYKGTENQHICQKSITPTQVFEKIKSDLLT
jgi:autotransporter strand-loop-strand O-heptosyltransferase